MIQDQTEETNTRLMEKDYLQFKHIQSDIFATTSITILVIGIISILDILDILNILNILNTINMLLIIRWCSSVQPAFSYPGSTLGIGTKSESGKTSSPFFVFLST